MKLNNTTKIFVLALPIIAVFRIVLKLFFIDTITGFNNQLPVLEYIFAFVVMFVFVGLFTSLYRYRTWYSKVSITPLLGIAAIFAGITSCVANIHNYITPPIEPPLIRFSSWILAVGLGLSVLFAISFVYIGITFIRNRTSTVLCSTLSITAALWQAVWTLSHFSQFKQITTVSDNLMETMYMVFMTLFWIFNAYAISGIPKNNLTLRCSFYGLSATLMGIPLIVGYLGNYIAFGTKTPSPIYCVSIIACCVYATVLFLSTTITEKK